jgi:hypothetical protein
MLNDQAIRRRTLGSYAVRTGSVVRTTLSIHVCDWASHAFLPMIPRKGCSLAKIQHHSLSSLISVPHHHFTYDTVLRDFYCEIP